MRREGAGAVPPVKPEREARLLVAGMLAAPLAWLLHLSVSYALVSVACRMDARWMFHAVTVAALLLLAPGGWSAWTEWRDTPKDEDPAPRGRHRTHFLAIAGIVNSLFFGTIIILAWSASLAIPACEMP